MLTWGGGSSRGQAICPVAFQLALWLGSNPKIGTSFKSLWSLLKSLAELGTVDAVSILANHRVTFTDDSSLCS